MTLKYKQAVLIQNLVDATSVPIGQPEETSIRATTQMLLPKQARLTFTNTVVTVPYVDSSASLETIVLPDRNLLLLGMNMEFTIVKGNAVGGIVSSTSITVGVGTTTNSDNLYSGSANTTDALTITIGQHTNDALGTYPRKIEAETPIYLYIATDGNPTADDTVTISGTIDFFYIDLSKPGL